jgi:hypothetical protein
MNDCVVRILVAVCTGVVLFADPAGAQPVLVHHWMADGTAGDAVSGQVATMRNGATFAPGQIGQAFSLDGVNDEVDAGNSAADYPTGSFTLAAWVRPTSLPNAASVLVLEKYECGGVCISDQSHSVMDLYLTGPLSAGQSPNLRGFVRDQDGGGPDTGGQMVSIPAPSILDGQFHHVAFVRDVAGNTLRLYLDGVLATSVALNAAVAGPLGGDAANDGEIDPITIGYGRQANGPTVSHFAGRIDDVREYSSALSTPEVATLVAAGSLSAVNDAYGTPANTVLDVTAPGVLANDAGGSLSAVLVSSASHGTVVLNANGSFTYTPSFNFVGIDTFTYSATSGPASSAAAMVSITVAAPTTVQPATLFEVVSVVGSRVTLRWDPPVLGPAPTSLLLEGGVAPGAPFVSLPIPADPPVFAFDAPNGAFFIRLRSVGAGGASAPSNEVPLLVGTGLAALSAPTNLTGLVVGSTLALSWKNTYGGGAPTGLRLNVTGAAVTSFPVGRLTESLAVQGVAGGTYTFTVTATNASGFSAPSTPITLQFPTACSAAPTVPRRFVAYHRGATLGLLWDPPTTGGAPTTYVVHVTGPLAGDYSVGMQRQVELPVPSGTYTFAVLAQNACGSSASTAAQTVIIP